jgi:nuclear pore complex protein Nup155
LPTRLLIKGARVLEFDKLSEICGHFQDLNFAKGKCNLLKLQYDPKLLAQGVVELPLRCAQTADPDSVGREYWHEGSTDASDPRAKFWELRKKCYDLVLQSLQHFEDKGAGSSKGLGADQTDDPEVARSHAYELAFSSEDELFHSTLYDWLISRGLADELLEVRMLFEVQLAEV